MSALDTTEFELSTTQYREVPRARATARGWCRATGVNGLTDDVLLVLTELLENALRHGLTPVAVRLEALPSIIRIEVSDGSSARPRRRWVSVVETEGRGLAIVDAITARHWGTDRSGTGKTVWAEIARH